MASLPPSFPKGLKILLVDDDHSRTVIEAQLRQPELQYAVTSCGSSSEALAFSRAASRAFDIVLAESKLVATDDMTGRAFVDAFEDVPVVLMSEGGATDEVMRAVHLGAVDFLDKPLSVLRLKNIWQHAVRRMMQHQRTSYDSTGFTCTCPESVLSEPCGGTTTQQPSMSHCLPSSMTAPMALAQPPSLPRCRSSYVEDKSAPPRRSSVDSPGTPSAGDAEPVESVSAGSVHQATATTFELSGTTGGSKQDTLFDADSGAMSKPQVRAQTQAQALPRPPLACKPSSFGALVPAPPVSQWPQLAPGCVWGTPRGGPLPPPLPDRAPQPQQVVPQVPAAPAVRPPFLVKTRINVDVPMASLCPPPAPEKLLPMPLPLPDGFLSLTQAKEAAGPLRLKLRKSNSLLDLINAALTTKSQS